MANKFFDTIKNALKGDRSEPKIPIDSKTINTPSGKKSLKQILQERKTPVYDSTLDVRRKK